MADRFKDKVVLVTGGSSGIGQATAVTFAREGARVVFTYHKSKRGALETGELIRKEGMQSRALELDHTSAKDREKVFAVIEQEYGELDVLVNNAGGSTGDSFEEIACEKTFANNCFGPIQCVQLAIPLLKKSFGTIVNVTSAYGIEHCGSKEFPAYSAAKAALNSATRTMAKELAPTVRINAVAPGYVETPLWGPLTEKQKQEYGAHQLINRFIQPEEIAEAILFVAGNEAITGEVLVIDGGISLKTL